MINFTPVTRGMLARYYADGHDKELAAKKALEVGQPTPKPGSMYYDSESVIAPKHTGPAAAALGFTGAYDRERFLAAGEGHYQVNGEWTQLRKRREGLNKKETSEEVVAWDMTISPPSSFSIACHFADPELRAQLMEVFDRACAATQAYADRYVGARVTEGGVTRWERAQGASTEFTHTSSRRGDPNTHRHCIKFDSVLCADGKYRALSAAQLMAARAEIDVALKHELALGCEALGLEIEMTEDGPELKQVDVALREALSTASAQMDEWTQKRYGKALRDCNEEQRQKANKATRDGKVIWSQDKQQEVLAKRVAAIGRDIEGIQIVRDAKVARQLKPLMSAREAVEAAYMQAHERSGIIDSRYWLAYKAAKKTGWAVSADDIHAVIEDLVKTGELQFIEGDGSLNMAKCKSVFDKNGNRLVERRRGLDRRSFQMTSRWYLELESKIGKLYKSSIGHLQPVCSAIAVQYAIDRNERAIGSRMTDGQKSLLQAMMLSKDGIIVVVGDPGTGKTFSLRVANELQTMAGAIYAGAEAAGYKLRILAPSKQGQQAAAESGIESQSIQYANSNPDYIDEIDEKTILIVDEAGMTTLGDTSSLVTIVERAREKGARVVLVGDPKQIKGVGAGDPFQQFARLAEERGSLVRLNEMRRGKTTEMRELHELSRDDQATAIQKLIEAGEGAVFSSENESRRLDHVARVIRAMPAKEQQESPVIVDTNADRIAVNAAVRKALDRKDLYTVMSFEDRGMLKGDKLNPLCYRIGDTLKFNSATGRGRNDFSKGTVGTIVARLGHDAYELEVDGKRMRFVPAKHGMAASVGEAERIGLDVGELIRFTAPVKDKDGGEIYNGDRARIDHISPTGLAKLTMLAADGKELGKRQLSLQTPGLAIRHSYASTVHSLQGSTLEGGVYYSSRTSANTFLVGITRFKDHRKFRLVCDLTTQAKVREYIAGAQRQQEKVIVADLIDTPPEYQRTKALAAFWRPAANDTQEGTARFVPVPASKLSDDKVIEAKLREAVSKLGDTVEISGSDRFILRARKVAQESGIAVQLVAKDELNAARQVPTPVIKSAPLDVKPIANSQGKGAAL